MESTSYHAYPKVYALGHRAIHGIFDGNIIVQEKIDGSQFSFGLFDGVLKCRSKGQQLDLEAPEKMFTKAVETVKELKPLLTDGYTYRGEFLNKPKHNTLAYDRTPEKYIILFDINTGHEDYLEWGSVQKEAERIGLETVPLLYSGPGFENSEQVKELMTKESILGKITPEGVVVKNHLRFTSDGKAMFGKFVTEVFKERHGTAWKKSNPGGKDVVQSLAEEFNKEAYWNKAVQHLAERSALENDPRDIGPLIKELTQDVQEENIDHIKDKLFKWAWPKISREITRGFPQWYKEKLLDSEFDKD